MQLFDMNGHIVIAAAGRYDAYYTDEGSPFQPRYKGDWLILHINGQSMYNAAYALLSTVDGVLIVPSQFVPKALRYQEGELEDE